MTTTAELCISDALEEYLEAIYMLSQKKPTVRITDIALYLGISKPSVNRAVNTLKREGLVSHEPYSDIMLTEIGRCMGENFHRKHKMIKKFLVNVLHLNSDEAEEESCQIVHNISQKTIDKMVNFMDN